ELLIAYEEYRTPRAVLVGILRESRRDVIWRLCLRRDRMAARVGNSRSSRDRSVMSEIARFNVAGPDAEAAASPTVQFDAFFEAEKDQLYRALCLVTRNRH